MTLETLHQEIVACRKCPRLVAWREEVAQRKRRAYQEEEYWGRPVPGFGDPQARVLVVGLAPGAHGSNRTGRQFTGDASGRFLYPALYRAGFANQPDSLSRDDGLVLKDLYLTAVCRCAPPGNQPAPDEIRNCRPYLEQEIEILRPKVFVALGRIAFETLKSLLGAPAAWAFSHGALYRLDPHSLNTEHGSLDTVSWLLASYHPSQQNTQTGKLTVEMFDQIWQKARFLLHDEA